MKSRRTHFGIVLTLASLLVVGLIVLNGCKKSEPTTPTEPNEVASAAIEQTTCPIMGRTINKDIFTEYKGKKVYFCCAGCKEEFEKEPEKYIAKLPQFKE